MHAQKQEGLNFIGVVLPVGRLTPDQIRGLAGIARALGDGDIRLTVWQNLLISGVPDDKVKGAVAGIKALGLSVSASSIRAGLVACTGNVGCRFAASDTKRHAEEIAKWCEARVELDGPVNIHLTGCHHSCAQHYIGDIGLIACKVSINDDGDTVEGYHVLVGGGAGQDAGLAREIFMDVRAEEAPVVVERLLKSYVEHRRSSDETFLAFSRRHDVEALKAMCAKVAEKVAHERSTPPADPAAHSGERAVLARAAHLAQRLLRRPGVARRHGHAVVVRRVRGADADAARSAAAEEDDDDAPWHDQTIATQRKNETRRGTPAPTPHDGGHGTTGLRTMRIQLSGLFQRYLRQKRGASESLRARRQGNRPDAQDAVRGVWKFVADHDEVVDHAGCRCFGCTGRSARGRSWTFARQSR